MKAWKLCIAGDWAHFKRPETNNNPLSHDFITKTALIGMIGAVLGISRNEMKELFPILSEALLYGVYPGIVKKESWSFTMRRVLGAEIAPRQMEILKNPQYEVFIALKDESQKPFIEEFIQYVKEGKAKYNPVLGLHNCPAKELSLLSESDLKESEGEFVTKGFIPIEIAGEPKREEGKIYRRWGYEKLPTYQDNDWWNKPDKYMKVAYVANGSIKGNGKHYNFTETNEQLCLI